MAPQAPRRHLSCLLLVVTTATMLALLPALAASASTPLSCAAVALAPRERCEMLAPAVRLRWSVAGAGNAAITFKV